MEKIKVNENTPLLKFLLWNALDIKEIERDEAASLYFAYQRHQNLVPPTEYEKKLIKELLYGIQT